MSYRHGKGGACTVGATVLDVLSWAVDDQVDLEESGSTTSGGHKSRTPGFDGLQFTIEAQWNAANGPFNAGEGTLAPGTFLTNMSLSTNGTVGGATNSYAIPSAIIEKATIKMAVKNVIAWTITGFSDGPFTRPSN